MVSEAPGCGVFHQIVVPCERVTQSLIAIIPHPYYGVIPAAAGNDDVAISEAAVAPPRIRPVRDR